TFVKAWRSIKSYRQSASKFKTWLLRIARNTSIDFLRKKKHIPFSAFNDDTQNLIAETIPDPAPLAEELFSKDEDSRALVHALGELSPPHREILLLYYTNDLTFEEMGELLGQPANTVKSRHRRAVLALRALLTQSTQAHL